MGLNYYIHRSYTGYLRSGLTEYGNSPVSNPSALMGSRKQEMLAQLKQNSVKSSTAQIEKILNKYFDARKNKASTLIEGQVSDQTLQEVEELIYNRINAKMGTVDINTLRRMNFAEGLKSFKALGDQRVSIDAINNRMQAIESIRGRIAASVKKGNLDAQGLLTQLETLDIQYQDILTMARTKGGFVQRQGSAEVDNFIVTLEDLLGKLAGGKNTKHGEFAEAIAASTMYLASNKSEKITDEILSSLIKGDNTTKAAISMDNHSEYVDWDIAGGSWKSGESEDGVIYSANWTQDKVDIDVIFNGTKIPASVKNYNFNTDFSDIHLLNGTSLIALLGGQEEFLYHWANISPFRSGYADSSSGEKRAANETMTVAIANKALIGGRSSIDKSGAFGNSEKAKLFIINDNSVGRFRVFDTSNIINLISKNLDLVKVETRPDFRQLENVTCVDKRTRITNLIGQMHAMKLEVSIDKSFMSMI